MSARILRGCLAMFCAGALQVLLITVQTRLIVRGAAAWVFIMAVLIALAWTAGVKGIAFGGWAYRVSYALGAGVGAVAGLWIARGLAA